MRFRERRVTIAYVLASLGLVILAVGAALHWQVLHHLPQIRVSEETWHWVERLSWVAGVVSLLLSGLIALPVAVATMIAAWQTRPTASDRNAVSADPHLAREAEARDRLKAYLGRRDALPLMGEPSTGALALRVHPAIPLASPNPDAGDPSRAASSAGTASVFERWQSWFQRARRQGKHDGLDFDLPRFVDREKSSELRDWLRAAAQTGGFVIVVGNSAVGKTRLLYQLAREVLPEFAVLAPNLGDGDLVNKIADATFQLPRLIVWLDELQRFLDGPYLTPGSRPITAAALRHLLDSPTPVVVLGTLWPEQAGQLRSRELAPEIGQPRARYPAAVDVLDDRRRRETSLDTFSRAERQKAAQLAAVDSRLAAALADRDFNVTEALAGAPELIRRYEQATLDQKAVLFAAIDARRLGIQAPLSEQLLSTTARGYLSVSHPDDTWFPATLADLVRHDRATAPLIEIYDAEHRAVIGYTVADYLLQKATRQRRAERIPAASWQSLIDHTRDLGDLKRLARSADNRLLYCFATPLYRRLDDAGDLVATFRLGELLAEQGQIEELGDRADAAGMGAAAAYLAKLLAEQGRVEALRVRADEELRARADAGDMGAAAFYLAGLLTKQGRVEELRVRADAGDQSAASGLARLLAKQGRVEELRVRADAGDQSAASGLAELLAEQDQIDELRARADDGDESATHYLAELLAKQGQVEDLRARANAGDEAATYYLAELLAEQGQVEELRARADDGDESAATNLAKLLAARGGVDELLARAEAELLAQADAGGRWATASLAELLAKHGQIEALRTLVSVGGTRAAELAEQGEIEELRARADAGDFRAAASLTSLLAKQGQVEELRTEMDAGIPKAGYELADLLIAQGRTEEGGQMKQFGLNPDGSIASPPVPTA